MAEKTLTGLVPPSGSGTDWERLRSIGDAELQAAIDVDSTDEAI